MAEAVWRPQVPAEGVVWAAAVYFATVSSAAFWRAVAGTGALAEAGGGLTALALLMLAIGVHVLLLRPLAWQRTLKPVLTAWLLLAAAVAYFAWHYGVHYDTAIARSNLSTDRREAAELLTPALLGHLSIYGGVPIALLWWVRLRPRSLARAWRGFAASMALTVLLLGAGAWLRFQDVSALMRMHASLRYLVTPANALVSTSRVLARDLVNVAARPRAIVAPDARLDHGLAPRPHVLVLVVGETVRAQNWGLNDHWRQTTPRLARQDVVNFGNVSACGSSTAVSLPCMLSPYGREDYSRRRIEGSESLLHVLDRTGVDVLWRDNQGGCKGTCDGLPFQSFREGTGSGCVGGRCPDSILLEGLEGVLAAARRDLVVILHPLGNHGPAYYRRYPPRLRRFVPDCRSADLGDCTREEIANAYDNAVLATDELLDNAVNLLKRQRGLDTALLYVSDHGESLGENGVYLHGLPYPIAPPEQLKVPMVAWLSPGFSKSRGVDGDCLRARARQPASHDHLFHSVLGLMQVKTRSYRQGLDVFAPCTRAASPD
ncbi:sulfatase-like hydrolase/transferase [Stenotrophomonas sp. HITSZ_GD]|uniref:phosphoethanolamine transferase n=1 Tax=Stenotrophomonas sp. HITSZ_GD TaxID=3037248 RepID=UPI00240D1FA4|nr:sulfatase-like hydrolase/transferase [Stenotrophomonas sp. HITSZ_GD]MDG2524124.1 sulfatase-like hydrolase/transferase [Stenotrophomonas sp. HITSZ_GD]